MEIAYHNRQLNFSKYINYIILIYAFLIPISRAGISILTVMMTLLWIMEGDFKRKFEELKDNKVVIFLIIFVLYTFISLFWTTFESLDHGVGQSFKIVRLIILPMIVIATTLKEEYIPKVITAFLFGMLVSEILSYGIFFEVWTWKHGSPIDPTPFMHHLDYSTFLAFTSLLLLNQFFHTDNWKLKFFYFVYFLFVASNLFINGGRTGQLAFLITLFTVGFLNIKHKVLAFILAIILVVAIFYSAYHVSPVFEQRFNDTLYEINHLKADSSIQYEGSFGQRLGAWIIATNMMKDNPLHGTGGGSEMIEFKEYAINSTSKFPEVVINIAHFHNEYIHTIVEYGIVGLILYLLIWYNLFKMPIKNQNISNLRVIFISVFLIASLVELIFHNQFPMSLFALFVGIFIMLNIKKDSIEICK